MELRFPSSSSSNGNITGIWLIVGIFVILAFFVSFPVSSYFTAKQTVVLSDESPLIQVYGRGVSKPVCGADNELFISFAKGFGPACDSDLQIYTQTWRSGAGEFSRTWLDENHLRAVFHLAEEGPFTLSITVRGTHIPRSPFLLHSKRNDQCSFVDVYRIIPYCTDRIFQRLNDGTWLIDGEGWRPLDCRYRMYQPFFQGCMLLRWRNIATVIFIGEEDMLDTMISVAYIFRTPLTREEAYRSMSESSDETYRASCGDAASIFANSSICFSSRRIPNFDFYVNCEGGKLRLRFLFAWQFSPHLIPMALAKLKGNVLILQSFLPGTFLYPPANPLSTPPPEVSADDTEQQLSQLAAQIRSRPDANQIMYVYRPGYVDQPNCTSAEHLRAHWKRAREYLNGLNDKRFGFYDIEAVSKGLWNASVTDRVQNIHFFHWHIALSYIQYSDVFDQHLPVWEWVFENFHGGHDAGEAHRLKPPPLLTFEEIEAGMTLSPQATVAAMEHGDGDKTTEPTATATKDDRHKHR